MPTLRPYQEEDVAELIKHASYGIFNEQRTGKTPTSLIAMTKRTEGRILIISTASMAYKWQDEARVWTGRPTLLYEGTPKQREGILHEFINNPSAILVISYGLLKNTKAYTGLKDTLKKLNISGIIVDEVHRAVGRKTSNFNALRSLVKIPNRYYLTGTPSPNHPAQVWSILTMIDPKEFTSYWKFAEDFFIIEDVRVPYYVTTHKIQEPTNFKPGKQEEYVALLDKYSIMRKRKDVMPWLLEMESPTRIRLPLSTQQVKYLYEMQHYYETEHIIVQGVLDQLIRYRQICLAPELLGLKGKSPKIEWLKQYIADYPDKQIIVFSRFTQFLKLIKKNIPHVGVLVGETTSVERKQLIDNFQSDKLQVLTIQIDAGKEGLTLDNADVLIFTDIYPPASDNLQAKDRIVATTESMNKPKEIIELAMADSYDELLYDLVKSKIEFTDIANNYINYLKERSDAHGI